MVNLPKAYHIAMAAACIEYNIERFFFGESFEINEIMKIGIVFAIFGDVLRKFSMFWCGSGFTHLIQYDKRPGHKLVTARVTKSPIYLQGECFQ